MNTLGTRIRKLRKRKKMTLEGLAGTEMTKGMLSLIENDKAKPSMESLAYIAGKLDILVNELLESISVSEIREILNDVKSNFDSKNYELIANRLQSVLDEKLPLSFEAAKLLEYYSKACYFLGKDEWQNTFYQADDMYLSLKLYNEAARLNTFFVWAKMKAQEFDNALQFLLKKKKGLDDANASLDIFSRLELDYIEVSLLFAISEYNKAKLKLRESVALSKKNSIFYRIEDLYRLSCFYAMMNGEVNDIDYYLSKLSLYGELVDSNETKSVALLLEAHYHNKYTGNYEKANEMIDKYYSISGADSYYLMEKGKVMYFLKDYKKALLHFSDFKEIPEWVHPFDLSIMYEVYAYMSRCYFILGDLQKAKYYSNYASDGIENLPDTPYKDFVLETSKLVNEG